MENKNELLKAENIIAKMKDSLSGLGDGVESIPLFSKYY